MTAPVHPPVSGVAVTPTCLVCLVTWDPPAVDCVPTVGCNPSGLEDASTAGMLVLDGGACFLMPGDGSEVGALLVPRA